MAKTPPLTKKCTRTTIENKKGLWKVKQNIILLNACIKESIEYKNLKGIESDNQLKTNWEKQVTKGIIAKIFCWYDVGILFLIAIFLHWSPKKPANWDDKTEIIAKFITLLLFIAFFINVFLKDCFFSSFGASSSDWFSSSPFFSFLPSSAGLIEGLSPPKHNPFPCFSFFYGTIVIAVNIQQTAFIIILIII